MSPKAAELLAIATQIVALEEALAARNREFYAACRGLSVTPRDVVRGIAPARTMRRPDEATIADLVLSRFREGVEREAGGIFRELHPLRSGIKPEVVHASLSKLAAKGLLVRVRFGVYRLPSKQVVDTGGEPR